jgi:nicotinamidase-related amidase
MDLGMDVVVVVDMQTGLLDGVPKYELQGVIGRINALTSAVRRRTGAIIWIRHCGKPGDGFERGSVGWAFLPELDRRASDLVVDKTLNDAFAGTSLQQTLERLAPDRVLVCGWATDFCVDSTVRSAISHDHHVVVVADAHTLSDRPHLDAASVIRHHNWVWSRLITNRSIRLATAAELTGEA